ncbi:M23 family peptidase [Desulfonema ishimotonii]|uniref:M23 family peptidase n=1 Tax=Desulfonema ishimotonii TaxID=45657 RepID=A0A401G063_9BACT|nr:M23 family metallopeptidase [Desulfonema ishimotonii]GBC62632.1 M23 family peptidase [Desulfonema ishimotonii]
MARDYAWRNWWNGNKAQIVQEVIIDVQPPKIEVLSQQHNLTQGGSGLVIYRLSEPCPVNGIHVGDNFFPGYAARSVLGESSANTYMSFIALDYRQGRDTRMFVSATDRAGNQSKAGFHFYIRGRNFKKDIIRISDNFLNTKMPEFENETEEGSGSGLIDKFLEINRKLRVRNTDTLKQAAAESDPSLYWKGAFLRLPNSARRANFADHREYHYKDNTVDEQNHMGIDLASTAHAPVPAANAGKVVFTRAVGIYGDTIVLDHGFGLFSTYSHLSHVAVRVGQMVKRGEIIGNTGTTGLAGGDHLHFGMIVHNVFVNPVEWWDSSWIKNNISNKINSAKKR